LLLSVAALDGVTSAAGPVVVEASVSVEAFLGFFFFEDLESDLTGGFWVADAAIVEVARNWEISDELDVVWFRRERYFRRNCAFRVDRYSRVA
jgi:hypothetical protein